MVIKAILYDLDGVLIDTTDWHYVILNKALEQVAGTRIEKHENDLYYDGLPTMAKLDRLRKEGRVTLAQYDEIYRIKEIHFMEYINTFTQERPEKRLLHEWAKNRGLILGCVTNCRAEVTEAMLQKSEQGQYMDAIVHRDEVNNPKPHPEPYITCMVKLGIPPSECIILEDSDAGMKSAYATGSLVIKVDSVDVVNISLLERYVR